MSILSAKNKASSVARTKFFADFDLGFNIHPALNDIRPLYDLNAIKNSVKNLVLTGGPDRPFHPELGSNVAGYLFENANRLTSRAIANSIENVLYKHEDRITDIVATVNDQSDRNAYLITIEYKVKTNDVKDDVSFTLQRLR